ncbi:MAG: thioesterase family protein [Melioribacteraceae bacterium]
METSNYKHKIIEVVRFHEVDMLSVCNNAVYFNYFEDARIKYIQDLIKNYSLKEIMAGDSFFIMAHNDADYIEPALLDDELLIYTRINFIKNSSFGFRHLVVKNSTGKIITRGGGVLVHINRKTKSAISLPQEFYDAVNDFEISIENNKEELPQRH